MKKSVLIARVQKRLNALAAKEKEYKDSLPKYMEELASYYTALAAQVKEANGDVEVYRNLPNIQKPYAPELPYRHHDQVKAAERNMVILEALDGDIIEVEKLRTGKNFSLESLFGEMLD
jgi:hypothetical protein